MKRIGLLLGFVGVLGFLLPLTAQDVKKDPEKTEKKEEPKKDEKKVVPKKEKFVHGAKFFTKIVNMKGDTNREYTIEVREIDPKKVFDVNAWSATRQQQLAQQAFNISRIDPKDIQGIFNANRQYQIDLANYKIELAKRSANVYSTRNVEVRAAENAKVRTMVLPIEFDDAGFQKKWTKKEIEERKDKSGLPGHFASEFDAIKQGQWVEIYMAKVAPTKKDEPKKKKGPADIDAPPMVDRNAEFVLIVIQAEGK